MFLGSICPIIIKSTAAYPDLFPWHFICSTHFYQQMMSVHWCDTFHMHASHCIHPHLSMFSVSDVRCMQYPQVAVWWHKTTCVCQLHDEICGQMMLLHMRHLTAKFLEVPCTWNPREVGYNDMEVQSYLNSFQYWTFILMSKNNNTWCSYFELNHCVMRPRECMWLITLKVLLWHFWMSQGLGVVVAMRDP